MLRGIRKRLGREDGFTILELMAALTILAVGFFALATAASTGLRSVAQARQRAAASELANGRLENLRNIPFDVLALDTDDVDLARSSDPDDPDFYLNAEADAYDYAASGTYEPLVLAANGTLPHREEVDVGTTLLTAYQYVTWIDDPDVSGAQDYKRITVVIFYRVPVNTGRPRSVQVSALVSPGNVDIPGTVLQQTEGIPGVPDPAPTTAPSVCGNDTQGPTGTIDILSGTGAATGYTASAVVSISMVPSDSCTPITVKFSNDGVVYGDPLTYDASNPSATWVLTDGDGLKSVYAQFIDGVGNIRTIGPDTVTLDSTAPTVPGSLTKTLSCSGSNRTASLAWGSSTDTNLEGYRVYRATDGGSFAVQMTTASTSGSDTHSKTLNSVDFRAVAYDKAGNESSPTNEVNLAKNQCS